MAEAWAGVEENLVDDQERNVLHAALDSFRQYRRVAHFSMTHRRRRNFYALPNHHWQMLASPPFNMLEKLDKVDDAIDKNAEIASRILDVSLASFGVSKDPKPGEANWKDKATPADIEKANVILRQFSRDWSEEGAAERAAHYDPVLEDLQGLFNDFEDKGEVNVLVPGAGLGRLVFEICKAGYCTEGNEISFHALMASNWILNALSPGEQFDLYPAALKFSNQPSLDAQLEKVKIPDVHPATELNQASEGHKTHAFARMGMAAADFILAYSDEQHQDQFDAVVTVFFVDTAPNIIRYLEAIHNTLRDGGYWINLGPLLWHFDARQDAHRDQDQEGEGHKSEERDTGIGEPGSVELTNEELLMLVKHMGFDIEFSEVRSDGQGYIQDRLSMVQSSYRVSHFIAKKIPKSPQSVQ